MKLKNKSIVGACRFFLLAAGFIVVAVTGAAAQEKAYKPNPKLARQAKITMEQARETAQNAAAGKIEEAELEKEHGKLVYSFDIRNAKGTITEVQVDAQTGAVVSTEEESKAAEAKEKRRDEQHAKKKSKKT